MISLFNINSEINKKLFISIALNKSDRKMLKISALFYYQLYYSTTTTIILYSFILRNLRKLRFNTILEANIKNNKFRQVIN